MKVCGKCGEVKSLDEFYYSRTINSYQYRCKDCTRAYVKQRRPEAGAERERFRKMRVDHPERHQEYNRRHRARYPERARAYEAWRRGRMDRVSLHDEEYTAVLRNDPCAYCGRMADTVDHVTPLHHGGTVDWSNLTAACRRCNASKGTDGLLPFLLRA